MILIQHLLIPRGHYLVDLTKTTKSKGFTQSTDSPAIIITHFWWSQVIVHVQGTEITSNHVLCNILCTVLCLDHLDMLILHLLIHYMTMKFAVYPVYPATSRINWLTIWLIIWLISWMIDWLVNWLISWLIDWLSNWLMDCSMFH